jgi:hypothetical protein
MDDAGITGQLQALNKTTGEIKEIVREILSVLPKPPTKIDRIIGTAAGVGGAISILGIIDLIIKWLGG